MAVQLVSQKKIGVNADELDCLVKRVDSFSEYEKLNFRAWQCDSISLT